MNEFWMFREARISKGGQIQIPAEVRKRWATDEVMVQDYGTYLRIVPIPDDPIGAVMGALAGPGPTANEMKQMLREEEAEAEERKYGHIGKKP
jgi:bifunctional DNA-binding transcriptional regulator/antitoxin component of YhaV-PrlF toxin-antitoxin module